MVCSLSTSTPQREGHRRYGTFEGVFVPTLLTILGVILFLREGWVVGNAGLIGALLIIAAAFIITGATGLCLASIATDARIGAGGAYAVITRSLGQAAGGSIGIPLYWPRRLSSPCMCSVSLSRSMSAAISTPSGRPRYGSGFFELAERSMPWPHHLADICITRLLRRHSGMAT